MKSSADDIEDIMKEIISTEVERRGSEKEFVEVTKAVGSRTCLNETGQNVALGKIPCFFFLVSFSVWIVSLLAVYFPVIGWVTPAFLRTMGDNTLVIFLASAVVSSVTSLTIGLKKLGR